MSMQLWRLDEAAMGLATYYQCRRLIIHHSARQSSAGAKLSSEAKARNLQMGRVAVLEHASDPNLLSWWLGGYDEFDFEMLKS